MYRTTALTLAFLVLLASAIGCDSAEVEQDPVADIEEAEVIETLEETIVGLWSKRYDGERIDWLFKHGGSYFAGQRLPLFGVAGRWSIQGDTLEIKDNGCTATFAFYRVEISTEMRNDMTVTSIFDDCVERAEVLAGLWQRQHDDR